MAKNPFGKSRPKETPYAIYSGYGPFGNTELRVLKTYQVRANEDKNPYARWFVAVKSDMTHGTYDMGDDNIRRCLYGLQLEQGTTEWLEEYHPDIAHLLEELEL
jgi:hypothetical protein